MSTTSTSSGWNRGNSTPKPTPKKKPSALRGIVAGLAVVAFAGACVFMFMGKSEKPLVEKAEKKPTVIKEAKPVVAKVVKETPVSTNVSPRSSGLFGLDVSEVIKCTTNDSGKIVMLYKNSKGKVSRYVKMARHTFRDRTDQILAMALGTPSGSAMPPIPIAPGCDLTTEFRKSLDKPIVIEETDSEHTRRIKEMVSEARNAMKELIDSGSSFEDVIREHRDTANYNAKIRKEMMGELGEILKKGDKEGAEVYVQAINASLRKMGIEEISMPVSREERLEEHRNHTQNEGGITP